MDATDGGTNVGDEGGLVVVHVACDLRRVVEQALLGPAADLLLQRERVDGERVEGLGGDGHSDLGVCVCVGGGVGEGVVGVGGGGAVREHWGDLHDGGEASSLLQDVWGHGGKRRGSTRQGWSAGCLTREFTCVTYWAL